MFIFPGLNNIVLARGNGVQGIRQNVEGYAYRKYVSESKFLKALVFYVFR